MKQVHYRYFNSFTHFLYIQEGGTAKTGIADARVSVWKSDDAGNKLTLIALSQLMQEVDQVANPGWYQWEQTSTNFEFNQDYIAEYMIGSVFNGEPRDIEHYRIEPASMTQSTMSGTITLQNTNSMQEGYQMIATPMLTGFWNPANFVANIKNGTISGSGYDVLLDASCDFTVELGDRIKIRNGNAGNNYEIRTVSSVNSQVSFGVDTPFSTNQTISVLVYKPFSGFVYDSTTSTIVNCLLDQLASIYECWRNNSDTSFQLNGGVYTDYNNTTARNLAYNNAVSTGLNTRALELFVNSVNTVVGGEDYYWQISPSAWWNATDILNNKVNFPLIYRTGTPPLGEEIVAMTFITMNPLWELVVSWGNPS